MEVLFDRSKAGIVVGHHPEDFIELAVDGIEPFVEVGTDLYKLCANPHETCGHFRPQCFFRVRDAAVARRYIRTKRFLHFGDAAIARCYFRAECVLDLRDAAVASSHFRAKSFFRVRDAAIAVNQQR